MSDIDTSVVMITWSPSRKRLEIMKRSFESLRSSAGRPHILVVVDNGPEEQTEWLNSQDIDLHLVNNVNLGVGRSRNLGAAATATDYIAFVDNDILYFPGWLNECVSTLRKYEDRKLIASPRKSSPMKHRKHHVGSLDDYELFNRASGQALVMKRQAWEEIRWSERNTPGGIFCNAARSKGYKFIWHKTWAARHLCKKPSYNYKHKLVNGVWRATSEQA
jgi:glycosyltransferase involved in cell wall biosynthesis